MNHNEFQGSRLKAARLLRAKTITALAEDIGISKQSISLYENGENKPEYMRTVAMAKALDVPVAFFFSRDHCQTTTPSTYFRSLTSATKLNRMAQSIRLEYVAKMQGQDPSVKLPQLCETCGLKEVMHKNISDLSR